MGKKGGTEAQSSNPQWLDDASEELYGAAKNFVFKPKNETGSYLPQGAQYGYFGENNKDAFHQPSRSQISQAGGGQQGKKAGGAAIPQGTKDSLAPMMGQALQGGSANVSAGGNPGNTIGYTQPQTPAKQESNSPETSGFLPKYFGTIHNNFGLDFAKSQPAQASSQEVGPAEMSIGNLRELPIYYGKRNADFSNNEGVASLNAYNFAQKDKGFDAGRDYLNSSVARFGKDFDPTQLGYDRVATKQFDQQEMDRYMNPFKKGALDVTAEEMRRQNEILQLQNNSNMVSKGAFGGSRHGIVEAENNRNYLDKVGQMYRTGMSEGYDKALSGYMQEAQRMLTADTANQNTRSTIDRFNEDNRFRVHESNREQFNTEQNRLIQAANSLNSLATSESNIASQDTERLLKTGQNRRQYDQNKLDFAYQQFLEQRDWPYQQLERLSGIMSGSPSAGSISHVEKSNPLASLAGIGMSLAAAPVTGGGSVAGNFLASDESLKENVVRVGEKDGINIYEFNYKGSDSRYRGVMAQEVMKVNPDAVNEEDGFLSVDYDKIGMQMERVA